MGDSNSWVFVGSDCVTCCYWKVPRSSKKMLRIMKMSYIQQLYFRRLQIFSKHQHKKRVYSECFFCLHKDLLPIVVKWFYSSEGYLCLNHLLWYSWLDEFNLKLRIQGGDLEFDPERQPTRHDETLWLQRGLHGLRHSFQQWRNIVYGEICSSNSFWEFCMFFLRLLTECIKRIVLIINVQTRFSVPGCTCVPFDSLPKEN